MPKSRNGTAALEWRSGRVDPRDPHVGVKWHLAGSLVSAHKNAGKILGKMGLLRSTMRTGYHLRVVGEKAESLFGMNHQLIAIVALQKKLWCKHFLPLSYSKYFRRASIIRNLEKYWKIDKERSIMAFLQIDIWEQLTHLFKTSSISSFSGF